MNGLCKYDELVNRGDSHRSEDLGIDKSTTIEVFDDRDPSPRNSKVVLA